MAISTPQSRYEAKNIRKMTFAFNRKTDADILARLDEVENRQGYIKQLVRQDIEEKKKEDLKMSINRYSYQELRDAATANLATQEDIDRLGEWFDRYGQDSWNGEYYDADHDLRVYPIIEWNEETDQGRITGYKLG